MKRLSRITRSTAFAVGAAIALLLAACGGGSSTDTGAATSTGTTTATASGVSSSTGSISAFGSVFVNGHEFDTVHARVIDDDSGESTPSMSGLEVGMTVDVKTAQSSSNATPVADEIHVDPLLRGVIDASDNAAGTLTVLGQTVRLTAATNFSDHRACVTATTSPCTAITGQAGLSATSGSGSSVTAGSYATVHGYLFTGDATTNTDSIVATLVVINDAPTATTGVNYKAEGLVNAISGSTVTIGSLVVDISSAVCRNAGAKVDCAGAFSVGQIVSAYGSAAPDLPAVTLVATAARLRSKLVVQTAGASVELEGKAASVSTSPASFVVRGVMVDASALTTGLPAEGDLVRVAGTVASGGTSVTASAVTVLHAAVSATYGFEGNVDSVAAGSSSGTFVLTMFGQSIAVDASTRLADRSVRARSSGSASNPFNITTFQTHLAASASQHVLVRAQADASGSLSALSVTIVPASTVSSIGGVVDATPAPVAGTAGATPTTFAVHGLAISADPASIVKRRSGRAATTTSSVSAGDLVLVRGTFAAGTLTVAAPATTLNAAAAANIVIDSGLPSSRDHDCF